MFLAGRLMPQVVPAPWAVEVALARNGRSPASADDGSPLCKTYAAEPPHECE